MNNSIQEKIARRADKIGKQQRVFNYDNWLQAESEVMRAIKKYKRNSNAIQFFISNVLTRY